MIGRMRGRRFAGPCAPGLRANSGAHPRSTRRRRGRADCGGAAHRCLRHCAGCCAHSSSL
uniref:Uncharacterized protein n=1 Tax=Macrostomum lignano TaxID=282301 RepID=A0A1I8F7C1_9PLAT